MARKLNFYQMRELYIQKLDKSLVKKYIQLESKITTEIEKYIKEFANSMDNLTEVGITESMEEYIEKTNLDTLTQFIKDIVTKYGINVEVYYHSDAKLIVFYTSEVDGVKYCKDKHLRYISITLVLMLFIFGLHFSLLYYFILH